MIVSNENPMPTASVWQLEFTRLIAFPVSPPFSVEQQWWKDLAAELPEDFVSIQEKHGRKDQGSLQGVLLSLTVDLSRIVWEARSPVLLYGTGSFPTLGPFREKVGWFVDLLSPWLMSSCPPLVRLAFSARLLQPAANVQEVYRVLADRLPAVNLDPNPDDFLLQINRRKKTSDVVPGLPINRMCTWSKMTAPMIREPGKPPKWPDKCYTALELDINTAPENTESLPPASLPRLFSELAYLGGNIADHGDKPHAHAS